MKPVVVSFILLIYLCVLSTTLFSQQVKEIPRQVNWAPKMSEVKNQGNRSTCAAFATIGLLEFELQKKLGRQVNLSEEFMLYQNNERFLKKDETSNIDGYMEQAYTIGMLTEEQWPYQPYFFDKGYPCYQSAASGIRQDSAVCRRLYKPAESVLKNATIVNLQPIYPSHVNLDILFRRLSIRPLLFCFPTEAFGYTDGNGVVAISKKLQQKLNSYGKKSESWLDAKDIPKHFAILCGYDMDKKIFYIRNSWGKNWGNNGIGTISFTELFKYPVSIFSFVSLDATAVRFPTTVKRPAIEVSGIKLNPVINADSSLTLTIQGSINQLGNRNIEIRSKLLTGSMVNGKLKREEVTLSNAEKAKFDDEWARQVWVFLQDSINTDQLHWTAAKPLQLYFPKQMVWCNKIREAVKKQGTQIILQTSVYTTTDTIPLKKLFQTEHMIDYRRKRVSALL